MHKIMTSCAVHYDVIYHPFPINCQYLNTWGCNSPVEGNFCDSVVGHLYIYIEPLYNKVSGITNIGKIQLVVYYQCYGKVSKLQVKLRGIIYLIVCELVENGCNNHIVHGW